MKTTMTILWAASMLISVGCSTLYLVKTQELSAQTVGLLRGAVIVATPTWLVAFVLAAWVL